MEHGETAGQRSAGNPEFGITLQDIVDGLEDELLVIDSDYRVQFANSVVQRRVQKSAEAIIGKRCYEVFQGRDTPCTAPLWNCLLRRIMESGSMTAIIYPLRISGIDTYLKVSAYPLRDSSGNIKAIVELRRDVTAERELETQILKRHHQLLALSRISSAISGLEDLDAILRLALDNVLEIVNGAMGGILLWEERAKKLYYRVHRGLSTRYTEAVRLSLGEGIAGRAAQSGEPILLEDISKDPRTVNPDLINAEGLKGFVSIPLKSKEKVVGVMNVGSNVAGRFGADDVSLLNSIGDYLGTRIEQAKLYERLARIGERYRALLRHALTAQEEERKRIARELHDETSQSLTSLTLSLQALIGIAEMKGFADAEFLEKLKATHAYAVHASHEIVRLMKELRPTLLDELGMAVAINRYAKSTLEPHGIKVAAEFVGTDQRFPPEVEVTLFRIAQGAIGNILEHAEAKNASIKLECDAEKCVLEIKDDGKGFDVSKITGVEPGGRGAGLFIMRERTSLVGGSGYVESAPGQGTKVTATVPLVREVIDEEDKGANSR